MRDLGECADVFCKSYLIVGEYYFNRPPLIKSSTIASALGIDLLAGEQRTSSSHEAVFTRRAVEAVTLYVL